MSAEPDSAEKVEAAELESAYLKHKRSLLAVAINITRCQASAEDAIQAAFSKLVQRSCQTENLDAYIFRAVRNAAVDICRKQKRENKLVESFFCHTTTPPIHPNSTGVRRQVDELIRLEEVESVLNLIDSLPADEKELILLKNFSSFTFEDIAEITDSNSNTVATRYRRLLKKIREKLKGNE